MGAGNAGGGGGGGSPNQMAKDKAAKDKAVRDKEARQAKIREQQKNKRPAPKDDNKVIAPKPKPTVPKKTFKPKDDDRDKQKVIVPKKKIDFKPVTKEVLNPNDNIQEKKKTPIVTPKYEGGGEGGNNNTTTPKVKVAVIPKVDTAPTKVEVDQSSATDTTTVKEDDIYTRKRKVKARGRSMMTLTSAQGVKKDDNLILGRRSLLGS